MDRIDLLVEILLDKTASIAERDDAAIDLRGYNDDRALLALIKIVTDEHEEQFIFDNCGESIATIWVKRDYFDTNLYKKMVPDAQYELYGYVQGSRPEWIEKYQIPPPDLHKLRRTPK